MPILNSVAKAAMKPVPRTLSPKAHSIADYVMVGSFFATGGWFWRRSKRAALASLICGGATRGGPFDRLSGRSQTGDQFSSAPRHRLGIGSNGSHNARISCF
jgi:hypothetical protein